MGITTTSLDLWVAEFLAAHRSDTMTTVSTQLMMVGISTTFLIIGFLVWLAWVAWRGVWNLGFAVVGAVATSFAVTALLKEIFGRERPPDDLVLVNVQSYAFPSTHATMTAAAAAALLLMGGWAHPRLLCAVLLALVVGIGVCLVYLGSHWTSDVLVGWGLGGLIGYCLARVFIAPHPVEA